jgi:hypothetical protein
MISDFCDWTGQKLLSDSHYPFPTVDYSSNNSIQDNAKPSVPITKFVVTLHSIAVSTVTPIDRHDVISRCIENAMVSMTQIGWETPRGPRTFGFGGVQQLVLDIHFVLRVCESYITDKTNDAANDVCEKALRTYFLQKKDGPNRTLKSGEWYDKRWGLGLFGRLFLVVRTSPSAFFCQITIRTESMVCVPTDLDHPDWFC